jgi:RNA polymerase sigma-70 factor (sigma-E family)
MAAWGADARYTRLVEQHGNSLLYLAVLLTGNRHDAEDVVQDVLITVASAWPVARPVAYLKRAVANRCVDVIRKRREIVTDTLPERPFEERGYLRHDENARFFELLQALPERQRETLVLRYYADLSDNDIAKVLGISVSTVRSQAHHALNKLRAGQPDLAAQNLAKEES